MLNRGYTLTGLLVAMTIGVILLTAAIKFVTGLMTQQLSAIQQLDLENQVARLAILISSEVQRAGYDANAHLYFLSGQKRHVSPFYPAFKINAHPGEPTGSCILFQYDKNHNGVLDTEPFTESRGFRLHHGAIEARVAGKSCHTGGWPDISDPEHVTITEFSLSPVVQSGTSILLALKLSGQHRDNTQLTASLNWPVLVRNY